MTRAIFLLTLLLAACSPEPRSASYFVAHQAEASRVVAVCKTGAKRGRECENAEAGVLAAKTEEQMKFFHKSF